MEHALGILNLLLYISCNFFVIAATILFLKCFCDPCFQWSRTKLICLLLYTLPDAAFSVAIINYFTESTALLICYACYQWVIGTFIVVYDYSGKRFRGIVRYQLIYNIITLCTALISEIASNYVFPNYSLLSLELSFDQSIITCLLYTVFFAFIFFYLYYRIYKQGIFLPWKKREKIFVLIYSLLCITFAIIIAISGKNGRHSLMVMGITFILSAMLIPVFIYYLRISEHYQRRTKQQETYLQSELEHFRQYMHAQEETRRFRHDIRNNLICMNEMASIGDSEKLSQYLKDLLKITDSLSFQYVTGDELLDSILNSKAQLMEQQKIRFELDGVLAGGLPWKPMDICAVFANALDNAIEACMQVPPENRNISIRIKSTTQFWLITIENSVAKAVDIQKIFLKNGSYTSKSDTYSHGIGTYSMKQTVESNGAIMKAECSDTHFQLEIMIDKNK